MANKRMFNMKICDSDAFLEMPLSTHALYFHLNMRADDDGFVGNPKKIQRMIGASEDDLKLLIAKRFVLVFDDGVIVIKHWKMHNCIQSDRYHPTVYQDEFKMLHEKPNKSYTFTKCIQNGNNMETKCIQNVSADIDIDIDKGIDKDLDKVRDKVRDDMNNINIHNTTPLSSHDTYHDSSNTEKEIFATVNTYMPIKPSSKKN